MNVCYVNPETTVRPFSEPPCGINLQIDSTHKIRPAWWIANCLSKRYHRVVSDGRRVEVKIAATIAATGVVEAGVRSEAVAPIDTSNTDDP